MRNAFIISLLLFFFYSQAQLIDGYKEEVEYNRESTFGINLNSVGGAIGGVDGRFAWKIKDGEWRAIHLSLAYIKHSKDVKFAAPKTGNPVIFGKLNSLYVLRTQYATEKRLFWKGKEDGVRLSWVNAGGLSIGIIKPYYIEYDFTIYQFDEDGRVDVSRTDFDTRFEAYDPARHDRLGLILGPGRFTDGFDEIKLQWGISYKTGINLEFGLFDRSVSGIETGFMFDYFLNDIVLFPEPIKPVRFQSSVYLSIYFGNRKLKKPKVPISEIPE